MNHRKSSGRVKTLQASREEERNSVRSTSSWSILETDYSLLSGSQVMKRKKEAVEGKRTFILLSIHHHICVLIEAHVSITEKSSRHFRQDFVIFGCPEEDTSLLRQPPFQVREGNHFRDVVSVLFSCRAKVVRQRNT